MKTEKEFGLEFLLNALHTSVTEWERHCDC
jgi:hypothetical protein